jgi:hypothetical protein
MPALPEVEATLGHSRSRLGLPDRGVVHYRDEVHGHPGVAGRWEANTLFFCCQYAVAPLVLDPDHDRDLTLVLSQGGFRVVRTGARP